MPDMIRSIEEMIASMTLEKVPLDQLHPWEGNPRLHGDLETLIDSFGEYGFTRPILAQRSSWRIVAGERAWKAAMQKGIAVVPVIFLDFSDIQADGYALMDNASAEQSSWDLPKLGLQIERLLEHGVDLKHTGFSEQRLAYFADDANAERKTEGRKGSLADRFLIPPFSILDGRQGYWSNRKQLWTDLGITSDDGRAADLTFESSSQPPAVYMLRNEMRAVLGREPEWTEVLAEADRKGIVTGKGTSVFDPVLCEVAYTWFSPTQGVILDPFAGGSVRGIVASVLNRQYVGIDLRTEQVNANYRQLLAIEDSRVRINPPHWLSGDSRDIDTICQDVRADLVFSCPPYADLEVYSRDERDLSNMAYEEFLAAYRTIIQKAVRQLRDDRFAVFVVGEIRDKHGIYRNFVGDTIQAFEAAGCQYYNEAILITPLNSLPVRVTGMFTKSRKLGKTHQNVLVFVKGDPVRATEACDPVIVGDLGEATGEKGDVV